MSRWTYLVPLVVILILSMVLHEVFARVVEFLLVPVNPSGVGVAVRSGVQRGGLQMRALINFAECVSEQGPNGQFYW